MTREQLILAMSLAGFTEVTDYTIDDDYDSIVMVSAEKPLESVLQALYDAEQERLRVEALQARLDSITDLSLCIAKYLDGKTVGENDSWNPAGFNDVSRFESEFGWKFASVSKPDIDQLEAAWTTVQSETSSAAVETAARSTKDLEYETTLIQCVQTALNGVEDLEPLVSPTNAESIARLNALANRQNKIINCLIAIIKKYIAPKLSVEDL